MCQSALTFHTLCRCPLWRALSTETLIQTSGGKLSGYVLSQTPTTPHTLMGPSELSDYRRPEEGIVWALLFWLWLLTVGRLIGSRGTVGMPRVSSHEDVRTGCPES